MENTYSIKNILQLLRAKLWLIIILTVIGGGAAFGYAKCMLPLQYQSYTTMYVKNNTQNVQNVNNSDLNTARSLVSTYIAVLKSDTLLEKTGDELVKKFGSDRISQVFSVNNDKVSPAYLRSCLTMAAVDQTEVLKITAVTKDAEISAELCQTIAELAPEFLIRVVGAGSVETIDEAQINRSPIAPNVPKTSAIGSLAGMLLAVLSIILIDFFDNTIKDSEIISKKHQLAVLGEIQDRGIKKSRQKEREHYLITDKTVPFNIMESYKVLRTNLIFSLSTSDKKIVAVSSALPGDGKSTIAANLAIAFSQLNENKVLLIDADMRKPVQHKLFNVKNNAGIAEYLGKIKQKGECVQKSDVPNLDIIPSGSFPPNPSELLASEQMEKLLSEVSAEYDYVIIDMPPVNIVSDPLTIGRSISGMVVVTHYGKTTYDDVDEMMRKVQTSDTKLLGLVLNEIKSKHNGKYGYSRKYKYYSYGNQSEKKEDKNAD